MKWKFIGFRIEDIPKESRDKLSRNDIKELLQSIPLENGIVDANSEEELVGILFAHGIHPIKIHVLDIIDNKILKIKMLQNKIDTKYINNIKIYKNQNIEKNQNNKIITKIFIIILTIIAILLCVYITLFIIKANIL
jgi:hypothetical protein